MTVFFKTSQNIRGLAFSLCLLAPLPGFAQDDQAARLAVAKDYVRA